MCVFVATKKGAVYGLESDEKSIRSMRVVFKTQSQTMSAFEDHHTLADRHDTYHPRLRKWERRTAHELESDEKRGRASDP